MIEKTYDAGATEQRLYEAWDEAGCFAIGGRDDASAYAIVIPPPNVTGSLHMGHALNNTLQDILIRHERMRGRDALWQPGMDHAGIATQMVVERQLADNGVERRDIGRDAFVERVWTWKRESGGRIGRQLRRLGASLDWSRERFTMDRGLSDAVIKVFVELYEQGLIYKDRRLVNWDPKLRTAISDLEVQQQEVEGHLWHFRYPILGEDDRYITVATTRPETMLGDTAVAVHPDDERYRDLVGRQAVLPLVGRHIAIVADAYADPEQGSGAVKITPAHDFNDFEVGRRHGLEMIGVLDEAARINDNAPPAYRGLDRFEAREKIVADMKASGLLAHVEQHVHTVPFGDRGGVPVEPFLTEQWYADAARLAEPAIRAVEEGRTRFVPENWSKTYFEWMRNIQPWCISRQLWWGHRIPAWYGPDGEVFVAPDEDAARARAMAHYGRDVALEQDGDVLDTWFSSALWPFSTLGWPREDTGTRALLPDRRACDGVRHHLLLGCQNDDDGPSLHGRRAVPHGLHPCPGARRERRQDVEVEGQRHRSAGADRRLRRRCPAVHALRNGRAGARHQAFAQAGRGLPQLRNQALERGALLPDARFASPVRTLIPAPAARRSTAGSSARWRVFACASTRRSRTTASTRRHRRSTGGSGTSSATGISNSPSRFSTAATRKPSRKPGRQPAGRSTSC